MANAAAVILSAIQKLDSWLLQKTDLRDDDRAKLLRLRSEKKDLLVGMMEVWENDKEMLYRLLVEVADLWDVKEKKVVNYKLYSFLGEMDDIWELNCRDKLHSLLVQRLDDIWELNCTEKLRSLLVQMWYVDPNIYREKLLSLAI